MCVYIYIGLTPKVCLSNREIIGVSRGRPYFCKWANNHVFLIVVAFFI